MKKVYNVNDDLNELFVGKSIVDVDKDREIFTLSDGTRWKFIANEGCGGCPSGEYWTTFVNGCDNIITNVTVKFSERPRTKQKCNWITGTTNNVYTISVIAEAKELNIAEVEGNDGNGYYGYGFKLKLVTADDNWF